MHRKWGRTQTCWLSWSHLFLIFTTETMLCYYILLYDLSAVSYATMVVRWHEASFIFPQRISVCQHPGQLLWLLFVLRLLNYLARQSRDFSCSTLKLQLPLSFPSMFGFSCFLPAFFLPACLPVLSAVPHDLPARPPLSQMNWRVLFHVFSSKSICQAC